MEPATLKTYLVDTTNKYSKFLFCGFFIGVVLVIIYKRRKKSTTSTFHLAELFDSDHLDAALEKMKNNLQSGSPIELTKYSIFDENPQQRRELHDLFLRLIDKGPFVSSNTDFDPSFFEDEKFCNAVGCFLGNIIGDALGAPFEFSSVRYKVDEMKEGFGEKHIWGIRGYNRFQLKPGQWTDDASMALCLADSLIVNSDFKPKDVRLRFLHWRYYGYCNAFGFDNDRPSKGSVGLGGNIHLSMSEFIKDKTDYTTAGDLNTSGNGSVMRNSPVSVAYRWNLSRALDIASKQSKTTHQGDEAAECCRLLTYICVNAINLGRSASLVRILGDLRSFETSTESVYCLAQSEGEWDWKQDLFKYSEVRTRENPGYIGSYAMDAMAMALHCVWTTTSFESAMLKSANLRGDSDSVTAVVGQIAGAIYSASSIPSDWFSTIMKWDGNQDIPLRAYYLYFLNEKHLSNSGWNRRYDISIKL